MKILLTGATGYIGSRLLPALIEQGYEVTCCVRNAEKFKAQNDFDVDVLEIDFENNALPDDLPENIDTAFYLIHSMTGSIGKFAEIERKTAENFVKLADKTGVKQIIYLSGLTNADELSAHLESRKNVENVLRNAKAELTVFRSGIIIGEGSSSFEIIRDLVEKLPVMVAPRWLNTKSQPISIRNIVKYLTSAINHPECIGKTFDIGGSDVLSYQQMLLRYAEVRGLKRHIKVVPVMTPRLSSYWLYFITSTSYKLAVNLVNSMKVEIICSENKIREIFDFEPDSYKKAVADSLRLFEQKVNLEEKPSEFIDDNKFEEIGRYLEVPKFGVYSDEKKIEIDDEGKAFRNFWRIGGDNGWYYANPLWKLRGLIDRLQGGIGYRKGRRDPDDLKPGDKVDFWRVLLANRKARRLVLLAEMKMPGDAWLEFRIKYENGNKYLYQKATFRPKGLVGRIYWLSLIPFHFFIFKEMASRISGNVEKY